jgi:integrating conjugative element protein (TIGR03746 family)
MRRYRHEIDNVRAHLRSLWAVIGLQLLIIGGLWLGWSQAPRQLTLHIPPDLRGGAVLAPDAVPPATVYVFAYYVFQQLNRWPTDGAKDYGRAIFAVSPYLTPRYRAELLADLDLRGRRGELAYRVRGIQQLTEAGYAEHRVEILDDDTWIAWLDVELTETVKGMVVKQTGIRYPIRIVRHAVDLEANPWGLALDGFAEDGPQRLPDATAAPADTTTTSEDP